MPDGDFAHFNYRWSVESKKGQTAEGFVANYNKKYGTHYVRSDIGADKPTGSKPTAPKPGTPSAPSKPGPESDWAKKIIADNKAAYSSAQLAALPWKLDPNSDEIKKQAKQLSAGQRTWASFQAANRSAAAKYGAPLPLPTEFEPPEVPDVDEEIPEDDNDDEETEDTRANAKAEIRRILANAGGNLSELSDIAWELYTEGIEDPQQLLFELESTEAFRERFPGIRNPETNELVMQPGAYIEFEHSINEQLSTYGQRNLSRAEVGALIQNGRSVVEVRDDLERIRQLETSSHLRREFYAYTGIDPGPGGAFALVLGLAPGLEAEYQRAIDAGVSEDEYFQRLEEIQPRESRRTLADVTAALEPEGAGASFTTDFRERRAAVLHGIELADKAGKAAYLSGGQLVGAERLRPESF